MTIEAMMLKWKPKIGKFYSQNKLYFLNTAMDKKDLEQELAVRLLEKLQKTCITGPALDKWLYECMTNEMIDLLREAKRNMVLTEGEDGRPVYSSPAVDIDENFDSLVDLMSQDPIYPNDLFEVIQKLLSPEEYEFIEVRYGSKGPNSLEWTSKYFHKSNKQWALRKEKNILKKLRRCLKKDKI